MAHSLKLHWKNRSLVFRGGLTWVLKLIPKNCADTDVYDTSGYTIKTQILILRFVHVNHLSSIQFRSTILANHFTFPVIVGGLI